MKLLSSIFLYLFIMLCIILVLFQIFLIKLPINKIFYCILLFILLFALNYEAYFLGCYPGNCELSTNMEKIDGDFACQESRRVNWRRSFIISFIPLFTMNCFFIEDFNKNLIYFIIQFFILYFYFNFDGYHRSSLACNKK
jgi:hypothetical protein